MRVDWEELPAVFDVEDAIKPGAPVVNEVYPQNLFVYHGKYNHQKLRFGDVEAGFAQADKIIEGRYQMSPIEQAPTETCGAIAAPETNDRFVVYTSTQALFLPRKIDRHASMNCPRRSSSESAASMRARFTCCSMLSLQAAAVRLGVHSPGLTESLPPGPERIHMLRTRFGLSTGKLATDPR